MAIDGRRGKKPYRAKPNRKLTTFSALREVIWSPEEGKRWKTPSRGIYRPSPVVQAVKASRRRYRFTLADSRADATRRADVVITMGPVKRNFGKPTLKLGGELSGNVHSDQIRRFLFSEAPRSVAFAIAPGQPYWKIFKIIRKAFDWSKNDVTALSDEDRQTVRELWATGEWTAKELAADFEVSQPAITFMVTGSSDGKLFAQRHKDGWRTLNSFVEGHAYWPDVLAKAEDLGLRVEGVGPMYKMVDKAGARKLKAAVQRLRIRKEKEAVVRDAKRAASPAAGNKGIKFRPNKGPGGRFEVRYYDSNEQKQIYLGQFPTLAEAVAARVKAAAELA